MSHLTSRLLRQDNIFSAQKELKVVIGLVFALFAETPPKNGPVFSEMNQSIVLFIGVCTGGSSHFQSY